MRIAQISCYLFSVPVDFRIATTSMAFSHHLLVFLEIDGFHGFGSAPLYNRMALKSAWDLRREVLPWVRSVKSKSIMELRELVNHQFGDRYNSILYAIDSALWDIEAKLKIVPANHLLGVSTKTSVQITSQVFIDSWDRVLTSIKKQVERGIIDIKVKIGLDHESDIAFIRKIRQHFGDDLNIKLDANRGYNLEQAIEIGPRFEKLAVSLWEEPIRWTSWDDLRLLRESVPLPVMLDESVQTLEDLENALEHEAMDILNLKLTRCGGITRALRLANICAKQGVRVSVGCSEDLGPGMASILHLSSVLDSPVGTEGIGWERIGFDCGKPRQVLIGGEVNLSNSPGLGVQVDWDSLNCAAQELGFGVWKVDKLGFRFLIEATKNIIVSRIQK